MIKKICFIMVVIGSVLLSSYDSCLDIQPVEQVIPTTLTKYHALLAAAYGLRLIDKSVTEFRTNIAMVTDSSGPRNFYSEIEKWNGMSPKNGTREFGWTVHHSVICYANTIIANEDNTREGSQEDIGQLVGEAYLSRDCIHFTLANLYGQSYTKEGTPETRSIPMRWDLDLEVVLPRGIVKEVYTTVLSDIESACGLMRQKGWGAVYAYRSSTLSMDAVESRVCPYMGNWGETYGTAERILVQKFTLEDLSDPEAKLPNNYVSAEMITAYEFFSDDVTSASILIPAFMERYDANRDFRRNKYYSLSGDKYISRKNGKTEHNCIFRTGEIYSNAVETAAQMNRSPEVHTRLLQLMRKRYALESYAEKRKAVDAMNQANLIKEILEERALGLAFEGHRWFDLCRTTHPRIEKVLNGQACLLEQDDSRCTLRIPQGAITANPGLLS